MIYANTVLNVADNSGAKTVMCIHVNGSTHFYCAQVGQIIEVSVRSCQPNGKIKKGEVHTALIVRTKKSFVRPDGTKIRFDDNAVVLINKKDHAPLGTRVFGPVSRAVRNKSVKIASLASEVL